MAEAGAGKPADFEIITDIIVRDKTKPVNVKIRTDFTHTFTQIERRARVAGGNIARNLLAGLGGLAGGYMLARAARGIASIHTEIETAQAGLATLFSAFGGGDIETSMKRARGAIRDLRRDAAVGAGELFHYAQGYQAIFGATSGAVDHDRLRNLTRNAIAAGFALRGHEGMTLAPIDIQQALSGALGDRTTPIAIRALQAIGMSADEFRKLGVAEKVDALNRGFQSFEAGIQAMGQTWEAQTSKMRDNIKEIARTATSRVFERWKGHLIEANRWLEANTDKMEEMATVWGERLIGVWDHVVQSTRTYVALLAAAAALQVAPGAGRAIQGGLSSLAMTGGFIGPLNKDGRLAWSDLMMPGVHTLIARGAHQRIGETARAGGFIGPLTAQGGLAWRDFASGAGIASLARGSGLLSTLTKLAKGSIILATVAALIDGVIGAWREFPGIAKFVTQAWGQLTDAFGHLIESLGSWAGDGSILNRLGALFLLGAGAAIHFLGIFTRFVASVFRLGGLLLELSGRIADMAWALVTLNWQGVKRADADFKAAGGKFLRDIADIWTFGNRSGAGGEDDFTTPNGTVRVLTQNINVNRIEVKTEINEDPARIAAAFREFTDKARRHPTTARRSFSFG